MILSSITPFLPEIKLEKIERDENQLLFTVSSIQTVHQCPLCSKQSFRVHSDYLRTLSDLPCFGQVVQLHLQVRKFFCDNPACERIIFTERFVDILPYARRTSRQTEVIRAIAFSAGGEVGARLAKKLALKISSTTLIRQIRLTKLKPSSKPKVVGVDDWAKRKGQQYGTVLVDLQKHEVLDLLDGRDSETLEKWLIENPSVEIISRDRAKAYASGARDGAPEAIQVVDRFHLFKNLLERVEAIFVRHHKTLNQVTQSLLLEENIVSQMSTEEHLKENKYSILDNSCSSYREKRRKHKEFRKFRYEEVKRMKKEGLTVNSISKKIGLSRRTVLSYLTQPFPDGGHLNRLKMGDYFKSYLWKRFNEGVSNATELYEEIKAKGFKGSLRTLHRYIEDWRNDSNPIKKTKKADSEFSINENMTTNSTEKIMKAANPEELRVGPLTPKKAVWLVVEKKKELTQEERKIKEKLFEFSEELKEVGSLVKEFQEMLRKRIVSKLQSWMERAKEVCQELKSFVAGIEKDRKAVEAAFTVEWSNGQVEGQVNRLKTIKKQMYGRAKLDLLKLRLLNKS